MSENNPLQSYFRKPKLSIVLPSHGQWYPENSLQLNAEGKLDIYAMTASDDIKMRTGDPTFSGKTICEVVKSCCPGILEPDHIPNVDIDSILLAIRIASFGNIIEFTLAVPNTTLTRKVTMDGIQLLKAFNHSPTLWDDSVTIIDEDGQSLALTLLPLPMYEIFAMTKKMFQNQQQLNKVIQNDTISDEEVFRKNLSDITQNAIEITCNSIKSIKIVTNTNEVIADLVKENPQDLIQIVNVIKGMDVEYFNAIKTHLDEQRSKFVYRSHQQNSTPKEIAAGAPENWETELTFLGSDFLPENK